MARGGRAWRGWFPFEGELTSGRPDRKEGIYFGEELPADDPRVARGTPLHGANLFPAQVPELRDTVLPFLDAMTALGHRLLWGMAVGLGLGAGLVPPAPHRRPADPVPHLPLPARGRARRSELGRRRAHRLRAAHDAPPGRQRRAPGARPVGLDRRAADPGHVRVQPRRHARAHDRRSLPVHAAPRPQPGRRRPAVVPVLLRPGVGRRGAPGPRSRRPAGARRATGGTARTSPPGPAPTATTSGPRSAASSPPSDNVCDDPSAWRRCTDVGVS